MTFGSELRKAREAAGISLAQLATQTRIRASVIEDLERDRYVSTGGAAYARGHIRVIAKILETDAEYLLELFDNQIDEDDRTINAKLSDNSATASKLATSTAGTTIHDTPDSAACAAIAAALSPNSWASRWQWLSISIRPLARD